LHAHVYIKYAGTERTDVDVTDVTDAIGTPVALLLDGAATLINSTSLISAAIHFLPVCAGEDDVEIYGTFSKS